MAPSPTSVSFDFGQVLAGFDPSFLCEKLQEKQLQASAEAVAQALPEGWRAYGQALRQGGHGGGAWKTFIRTILTHAGAQEAAQEPILDWLLADQPVRNLWRKPVPGMIELVRKLRTAGVAVGIISNSEGALVRLVDQLGWSQDFDCIADSGVLGMEKPNPEIFEWYSKQLAIDLPSLIHIGDSWTADVQGALNVGASAIWYPADSASQPTQLPERVYATQTVEEVTDVLVKLGFRGLLSVD
jgi:HAD superfamily hydrolase (TIGR01509 family)